MTLRYKGMTGKDLGVLLRQGGEKASRAARQAMREGAKEVVREAKLNVPVDTHGLEGGIKLAPEQRGQSNRLEARVVVEGVAPDGTNLDDYATIIHDNYETMKPGPGTLAKRAALPGRYVGGDYLYRAYDAVAPKLLKDITKRVFSEFGLD